MKRMIWGLPSASTSMPRDFRCARAHMLFDSACSTPADVHPSCLVTSYLKQMNGVCENVC
jgi:hypothetical protein